MNKIWNLILELQNQEGGWERVGKEMKGKRKGKEFKNTSDSHFRKYYNILAGLPLMKSSSLHSQQIFTSHYWTTMHQALLDSVWTKKEKSPDWGTPNSRRGDEINSNTGMSRDPALRQVGQKDLKKKARLGYITAQERRKKWREWGRRKREGKRKEKCICWRYII